jgi:formate dehydrogenase subunit gamma
VRQRGPAPAAAPTPADPARAASVRAIAEQFTDLRGPLLPDPARRHGRRTATSDDEDVAVIADVLNLSRADVHGVVSFYHDFRRTPPPAHRVQPVPRRGLPGRSARRPCMPRRTERRFACWRLTSRSARSSAWAMCALGPSGLSSTEHWSGALTLERHRHGPRGRVDRHDARSWVLLRQRRPVAVGRRRGRRGDRRRRDATVRRNGSRGMLWLEPLVEVETDAGRIGYGNITEAAVRPQLRRRHPRRQPTGRPRCRRGPPVAGRPAPRHLHPGRAPRTNRPRGIPQRRGVRGPGAGPHPRPRRRRRRGHHLGPAWTRRGRLPHGHQVGDRPHGRE